MYISISISLYKIKLMKLMETKFPEEHPFGYCLPFHVDVVADASSYFSEGGWIPSISRIGLQLKDGEKVADTALGKRHTLVLTSKGRLMTFGENCYGQLGRKTIHGKINEYTSSNFFQMHQVVKPCNLFDRFIISEIVCGDDFSLARTNKSTVMAWGHNRYGQLGLGHFDDVKTPTVIEMFNVRQDGSRFLVRNIKCGANHSVALSAEGHLYTWGKGDLIGQGPWMGRGDCHTPTQIERGLPPSSIKQVECGSAFTIAVTFQGEVYGWGINNLG